MNIANFTKHFSMIFPINPLKKSCVYQTLNLNILPIPKIKFFLMTHTRKIWLIKLLPFSFPFSSQTKRNSIKIPFPIPTKVALFMSLLSSVAVFLRIPIKIPRTSSTIKNRTKKNGIISTSPISFIPDDPLPDKMTTSREKKDLKWHQQVDLLNITLVMLQTLLFHEWNLLGIFRKWLIRTWQWNKSVL